MSSMEADNAGHLACLTKLYSDFLSCTCREEKPRWKIVEWTLIRKTQRVSWYNVEIKTIIIMSGTYDGMIWSKTFWVPSVLYKLMVKMVMMMMTMMMIMVMMVTLNRTPAIYTGDHTHPHYPPGTDNPSYHIHKHGLTTLVIASTNMASQTAWKVSSLTLLSYLQTHLMDPTPLLLCIKLTLQLTDLYKKNTKTQP